MTGVIPSRIHQHALVNKSCQTAERHRTAVIDHMHGKPLFGLFCLEFCASVTVANCLTMHGVFCTCARQHFSSKQAGLAITYMTNTLRVSHQVVDSIHEAGMQL